MTSLEIAAYFVVGLIYSGYGTAKDYSGKGSMPPTDLVVWVLMGFFWPVLMCLTLGERLYKITRRKT